MTKLNKALLASTAIAFASGLALPAAAQDASAAPAVVKSSKKMKLRLYGQIARGFGFISDGENQQFRQGQLSTTSSRMGIDGRGKINKDWSLRTRFEFQVVGDGGFDPQENSDGDRERFRIRHTDAIVSNKRLGAIWLGRGDTATNGVTEVTLAKGMNTAHLGGDLAHVMNGVPATVDSTGAQTRDIRSFYSSFDGAGRATRIRYDTPSFAGFKVSASYIDSANLDAAVRYSGGGGGAKVKGAVGFARIEQDGTGNFNETGPEDTSRLAGSFSVMLAGGFGITMSGGHEWYDASGRDNAWNVNPSIWYTMKATEVGPTTVELSYAHSENVGANDDDADAYGITLAQVLANTGTDTYLTFRYYDMEQAGADLSEAWMVGAGFRARF
jgi:predicted porin